MRRALRRDAQEVHHPREAFAPARGEGGRVQLDPAAGLVVFRPAEVVAGGFAQEHHVRAGMPAAQPAWPEAVVFKQEIVDGSFSLKVVRSQV